MGLFAKFTRATPEMVASRYFGGMFYGTEEQKSELAIGLLLTFKLAHNEQWPKSMDELGRWVDTEFGYHVGHGYIKNWPEFMDTIAARHGTTLNSYAKNCGGSNAPQKKGDRTDPKLERVPGATGRPLPGEKPVQNEGQEWTVTHAFTREIEAHTNLRCYKNALADIIDNVLHLESAGRENSRRPKSLSDGAVCGAQIRRRFFALIEAVESKLGEPVVSIQTVEETGDDALMVHFKLEEEVRNRPDGAFDDALVLEAGLNCCFITKDARRRLIEEWPSTVAQYRGKDNSETVLREKAGALAMYVVATLDSAEMAEGEISDEQNNVVRVEEAAVRYRVLDEIAFRLLRGQRDIFVDFLLDDLAFHMAFGGIPPKLIYETMVARSREYAGYPHWVPAENASVKGTLLWEAAKHVGEPIGLNAHAVFLAQFGLRQLEKLKGAMVHELLIGR